MTTYSFATLDVPGSFESLALGINNAGNITGWYQAADGYGKSGYLESAGVFELFHGYPFTKSNDVGQAVGQIGNSSFSYDSDTFTTFDIPGSLWSFANDIDASGNIVGGYGVGDTDHGFLKSGSTITSIDYPGAAATLARGINDFGEIVGEYYGIFPNYAGTLHSYIDDNGVFSEIIIPGQAYSQANDINNLGVVAGMYATSQSDPWFHGYVYNHGVISVLDMPGAYDTMLFGINDAGVIVGGYRAADLSIHGFVATPVGGDSILGGAGNDSLSGGAGDDTLDGGAGKDTIVGSVGDDFLIGGAGNDLIDGGVGNDSLSGGAGNDSLVGGTGDDTLDGGPGADTTAGGTGNDTYYVDPGHNRSVIVENIDEGTDTVVSSSHFFLLPGNVEVLLLAGAGNFVGWGNAGDNVITGNSGNNVLRGGRGNDTLNGGAGHDSLFGGVGNDGFVFHAGQADGDAIADFLPAAGSGDLLTFTGYGTADAGATFQQVNATDWRINAAGGGLSELLRFANAPAIGPDDYHFV